jgi:hypothetical protein
MRTLPETILVQPTYNQRYSATEREHALPIVTEFINVFIIFRVALPAHNGLVAGSSPAGPTNQRKAMKVNSGAGTKFLTGLPAIITMEEDKLPFIRQDQSSQSAQCSIVTLH